MFRRILMRYWRQFILFVLCIVVVITPIFLHTHSLYRQQVLELYQSTIKSGVDLFDQQIESLTGIALGFGSNREYYVKALKKLEDFTPGDYLDLSKLQKDFHRIMLAQHYVADYALYMQNGTLLSASTSYSDSSFYAPDTLFAYEGWSLEQWQEQLIAHTPSGFMSTQRILTRSGAYSGLTFVCSMSAARVSHPNGIFFAVFPEQELLELILPVIENDGAQLTITDREGKTLLDSRQSEVSSDCRQLSAQSKSGLTFTATIPNALISRQTMSVTYLMYMMVLTILLAGALLGMVFSYRASSPIRKLVNQVHSLQGTPAYTSEVGNEFDYLSQAVHDLDHTARDSQALLVAQTRSLRLQLLGDFLRQRPAAHGSPTWERMRNEFHHLFPDFPHRYRVALIVNESGRETVSSESLRILSYQQMALTRLCDELLPAYLCLPIAERTLAAIFPDDIPDTDLTRTLSDLKMVCQEQFQVAVLVTLSDCFETERELFDAYAQAQNILRLADLREEAINVWQTRNFPNLPQRLPLDYGEMQELHTALVNADNKAIERIFWGIEQMLCSVSVTDILLARQAFYNIRGVLLRVKLEHFDTLKSIDIPDGNANLSFRLMLDLFRQACVQSAELLAKEKTDQGQDFSQLVCAFIDDNLGRSSLSARMTADHFGISEPTLQKLVRAHSGKSYFEYVESNRHALAWRLLTTTDIAIADIAEQCGYNSLNSFYKAFKRLCSLTPRAVREQSRSGPTAQTPSETSPCDDEKND